MLTDVGYGSASGLAGAGAVRIQTGVASLWPLVEGAYATLTGENGALHFPDWTVWYADSLAKVWMIGAGNGLNPGPDLVYPARALTLMRTFVTHWPEWSRSGFKPRSGRSATTASGLIGYQPMVGAAALACRGVENINTYAIDKARKGPFNVSNAGQIILTLGSV